MSLGICAHDSRYADAKALAVQLRADVLSVDGGAMGTIGSNRNHSRTWRWAIDVAETRGDEWVGVVEDDAIPVPDILRQLPAMLAAAPTSLVSAYLGTCYPIDVQQDVRIALRAEPTWLVSADLLHHVAVFARIDVARQIADHLDQPQVVGCDTAIGILARSMRWPVSYCVPSLFDHADDDPIIDVAERQPGWSPGRRIAWQTGGRADWSAGAVHALDRATENYYPAFRRGSG